MKLPTTCKVGARFAAVTVLAFMLELLATATAASTGRPRQPPGEPSIQLVTEGDGFLELACESEGGRPAAEIEWRHVEDGKRILSQVTEVVHKIHHGFRTVSTVRLDSSMKGSIECSAQNDAFPNGKVSDRLHIGEVEDVEEEIKELEDGDSIIVACENDAVASGAAVKFKWSINGAEIFHETENMLELQQFSRSYDNAKIKCFKQVNDIGKFKLVRSLTLVHKSPKKSLKSRVFSKQNMLSCVPENENDVEEPKEVFVRTPTKKGTFLAWDSNNRKFKCRMIVQGYEKLNKLGRDVTVMSLAMSKMSNEMNSLLTEQVTSLL